MARDIPGTAGNLLRIVNPTGAVDISGTLLTIVAWVNPDVNNATQVWLGKWGAVGQYQLAMTSGGKAQGDIGDSGGGSDTVVGATTITTGAWHHLALRKNGTGAGALAVFLDGASDGSITSNKTIADTANNLELGASGGGTLLSNGRIAEVAFWNVALTDAEIAALAKGVSPLRVHPKNLAAYYPLWGVGAGNEPDLSGNGQTLTEVGTVGVADHAPVGPYAPN